MRRVMFLVGASGVGKTTVARVLERRAPWEGHTHYFDTIGVPSAERMEERMDNWAAYLAGQAHALELPVLDTSHAGPEAIALEIEARLGIA